MQGIVTDTAYAAYLLGRREWFNRGGKSMAKKKIDGVVEAVRYRVNGDVDWFRIYERRGSTFSDRLLVQRLELVNRLKAGKNYMVGKRLPYLASTFEMNSPIRLIEKDGKEILVTGDAHTQQDYLADIPVI